MAGVPEGNLTLSIPKVHVRRGGPERHRMVPRVAQQARLGGIVIQAAGDTCFLLHLCWGWARSGMLLVALFDYLWPCLTPLHSYLGIRLHGPYSVP